MRRTVDQNAAILLNALLDGPVVNATGGVITDGKCTKPLMNTTEMCDAVRRCGEIGVVVERTDAGGLPTWDLKRKVGS